MAKPLKHRQPWTPGDIEQLKQLAEQDTPIHVIAAKLRRSFSAVMSIAHRERILLPPMLWSRDRRKK
jgi:hypothetical protein